MKQNKNVRKQKKFRYKNIKVYDFHRIFLVFFNIKARQVSVSYIQ